MRFVMREDEVDSREMLPAQLPWELIHGIGLVESWREDHWVEPPRLERLPFSLLYHQTMATLASEGELTPAELARRVLTLSPFRRISPQDYRTLLLHLLDTDQIQRTERGGLIVGLAGERVTSGFKFYAVFQENEEYSVRADGQELGTLVQPPPAGEKIAIAGRVWEVEEVDPKRHIVWCRLTEGRVPAFFGLCPGDIHTHILEKTCEVLCSDTDYPYLMPNARKRLAQARSLAQHSGMTTTPLINLGGSFWALFPWLGTYPFLALERLIRIHAAADIGLTNFETSRPWFIVLRMKASAPEFFRALADAADRVQDPMCYLYPDEVPLFEKYDEALPAELVRKGFACGVLGIDEMRARVKSWAGAFQAGTESAARLQAARRGLHHKEAAHSGLALSGLRLGLCVSGSEFMRFAHLTREIVVRQQCGARTEINAEAKERADRDESAAHECHRRKAEMLRDEGSDKRSAANTDIEDARIERCCDVRSIGGHHKHAGTERHADCRLSSAPEQKQRHEREPRRA